MLLIDTSVWVDHLRNGNDGLRRVLDAGEAACHPFVIGELACGNLVHRKEILGLLCALPSVSRVSDDEVLFFIERQGLYGKGLGLIDVHLLASCSVANTRLWTLDKMLRKASRDLGLEP
jgi:predicted nucleic acid-binding protein